MYTVFHRTERGASMGYSFDSYGKAIAHLKKLFSRHVEAKAIDQDGEIIGRVWFDDGINRWNWFFAG